MAFLLEVASGCLTYGQQCQQAPIAVAGALAAIAIFAVSRDCLLPFGEKPDRWCANRAQHDEYQREPAEFTPHAEFRELTVWHLVQPTAEASKVWPKSA